MINVRDADYERKEGKRMQYMELTVMNKSMQEVT